MIYSLDTNVCVHFLNGGKPKLTAKLLSVPPVQVTVCSIVRAELFYGAAKSNSSIRTLARQQKFLQPYLDVPFDEKVEEIYGNIRANLKKQGRPIGYHDLEIAAIALASNLVLVTHNTREFGRISGLQIEDWEI